MDVQVISVDAQSPGGKVTENGVTKFSDGVIRVKAVDGLELEVPDVDRILNGSSPDVGNSNL